MTIAPKVNNKSAAIITFFRPILSDIGPERSEPNAAPRVASETTRDLCSVVMSGQSSWKYSYAPEITPVSYPNRNPPIAAMDTSCIMKHKWYSRSPLP